MKCKPCKDNGHDKKAIVLAPQSIDQGNSVTMTPACEGHYAEWWDGADWNGDSLTVKLEN
jgi:hypothetical protein